MVKEEFLYLVWTKQLYDPRCLISTEHEELEVLNKGLINNNDGPDILEAKIKVGNTILVGSIEFHVYTSDWIKHNHQNDKAYKNVILHVVWIHDREIKSLKCPTLELQGRVPRYYFDNYKVLMQTSDTLPCSFILEDIDTDWLKEYREDILKERFYSKIKWVETMFNPIKLDQIYQVFMTVIGAPQNDYGFKMLSERIPYHIINKYRSDKHKLEALLFGVSGLLNSSIKSSQYERGLQKEYAHLKKLHNIESMSRSDWRFLRIRPLAFPTIRIALLADLFHKIGSIEQFVLHKTYDMINEVLNEVTCSEYWNTHYVFEKESKYKIKLIGKSTMLKLWINAIIPLRILHSENKEETIGKALTFLQTQLGEKNRITDIMKKNGFMNKNAFQSQFNLHKYKYYCIPRKCLNCGIGYKIIRNHD